MEFKDTLNIHLEAIKNRDIDGFKKTIAQDDRLTVILPNGSLIKGYDRIIKFHENWFKDMDWSIDFSVINELIGSDLSSVLIEVRYNDINEEKEPYQLEHYLNLIFIKENSDWSLIYDQNTLFPKK